MEQNHKGVDAEMEKLLKINRLRELLVQAHERYGCLHHRCVVRVSQMLDRKLNEFVKDR